MMRQLVILLVGIILTTHGWACSCDPVDRATEVRKALGTADLIFCGELIPVENDDPARDWVKAYQFRIVELFKGHSSKTILNGCITGMCSILPRDKGLWLVYAQVVNDSTIDISQCSPSIPMYREKMIIPPPSLLPAVAHPTKDSLIVKVYQLERKVEGLSYWLSDMETLRAYQKEQAGKDRKWDWKDGLIGVLIGANIICWGMLVKRRKGENQLEAKGSGSL